MRTWAGAGQYEGQCTSQEGRGGAIITQGPKVVRERACDS